MFSIARKPNEKYRKAKEDSILEKARIVFCRKGYLNVTMQDIIDECNISRGGIYLYFNSVDEIFRAVAAKRNKKRFSSVRKSIDDNKSFATVLNSFFSLQKERLLHMENSLLRSMYEYTFSGAEGATQAFRNEQLANLRKSILSILTLGIKQKVIRDENIATIADHVIVIIEGLGVMALVNVLTENIIDEQFAILNGMIENITSPERGERYET
ncbi:MAG: TetR/AcrR family transcriptional regulator [Oscillospiraceae bacterium]|nr:TetR/AcrR family transcriptional regulator [Oscillospiraceae bacterium]